jgi:alkaline phosphatase
MKRRYSWPVIAGLTASALVVTAFGAVAQTVGDDFTEAAYPSQQEQVREREALRDRQRDYARGGRTGNAIFLHPDGAGLSSYHAARAYWDGPDAVSEWDRLPEMAAYRGHMADVFTGTSNGGATTHAFGYKVSGPGSFGRDGEGDAARPIQGLSGYPGSVMREAAAAGHPIGVINDGVIAEPGTGAFLAEVGNRDQFDEISRQMILGRPGTRDALPQVIMGGGERDLLPQGTPVCPAGQEARLDCSVHGGQPSPSGAAYGTGARTDGVNLLVEAQKAGYEIVRTRAQFQALAQRVKANGRVVPRVLGVFAYEDTFNDVPEERLIASGYVDPSKAGTKQGDLVLYGTPPGTRSAHPPTLAEMSEVAVTVLERAARRTAKPYLLVAEPESSDNFGNNNNAIGQLTAWTGPTTPSPSTGRRSPVRPARCCSRQPTATAAVCRPSATCRARSRPPLPRSAPTPRARQPTNVANPVDGIRGRGTAPFVTEPDQFGRTLTFGVAWPGTPDVAGGIVSRAEGVNSELLSTAFSARFDNVDVYRMLYLTLFDRALPYPRASARLPGSSTSARPERAVGSSRREEPTAVRGRLPVYGWVASVDSGSPTRTRLWTAPGRCPVRRHGRRGPRRAGRAGATAACAAGARGTDRSPRTPPACRRAWAAGGRTRAAPRHPRGRPPSPSAGRPAARALPRRRPGGRTRAAGGSSAR